MSDESSLSEHEQRILEQIERGLAEEDPDFVRHVEDGRPPKKATRNLRLGVLGLIIGFGLLLGYTSSVVLGILGFLVMLGGAVLAGTSVRRLVAAGRPPGASVTRLLKGAKGKMQPRRRPDGDDQT
jgi:uncharacterized membrane protein YedE/YeeE